MAIITACWLIAVAGSAYAESEPNDAIWQAEGPIANNVTITGALPQGDIADWYVLYVHGNQQLHLTRTVTQHGSGSNCLEVFLTNGYRKLPDDYTTTETGTQKLWVEVFARRDDACSAYDYSFQITSTAAFNAGPARLAPVDTAEPNETPETAAGPLTTDTLYRGAIETTNDRDEFYFYTAPGTHQIRVNAYRGTAPTSYPTNNSSAPDPAICRNSFLYFRLTGPDGSEVYSLDPENSYGDPEWDRHIGGSSFTSTTPGRWRVTFSGEYKPPCNVWLFDISPAGALAPSLPAPTPPPPPTPTPAPLKKYGTSVTLRRHRGRYRGRVRSSGRGCVIGRKVVLRRVGSGKRSFATAYTRSDGTFTFKRRRIRGRVYAAVSERAVSSGVCRFGSSSRIRG